MSLQHHDSRAFMLAMIINMLLWVIIITGIWLAICHH